jgi:hypothetical protein
MPSNNNITVVTESLGQISGQIANMHQGLMSLTDTVERLSSTTIELANRVAALEDITIEAQPQGKKKVDIPRDLSVRI